MDTNKTKQNSAFDDNKHPKNNFTTENNLISPFQFSIIKSNFSNNKNLSTLSKLSTNHLHIKLASY